MSPPLSSRSVQICFSNQRINIILDIFKKMKTFSPIFLILVLVSINVGLIKLIEIKIIKIS